MNGESGPKKAFADPASGLRHARHDCSAHRDRFAAIDIDRSRAGGNSARIEKTLRL